MPEASRRRAARSEEGAACRPERVQKEAESGGNCRPLPSNGSSALCRRTTPAPISDTDFASPRGSVISSKKRVSLARCARSQSPRPATPPSERSARQPRPRGHAAARARAHARGEWGFSRGKEGGGLGYSRERRWGSGRRRGGDVLVKSLAFSRRCRTTSRVGELPASARSAKSSAAISVSGQSPCRSRICARSGPA